MDLLKEVAKLTVKEQENASDHLNQIRRELTQVSSSMDSVKSSRTLTDDQRKALEEAQRHVDKARMILFDNA